LKTVSSRGGYRSGQGAIPHVAREDCGYAARWIFDHPERSNGMNLEVAIAHMTYTDIAEAFQKVTGHPAQYIDTDLDAYWNGPLKGLADLPAGCNADPNDKSTVSFRDNFTLASGMSGSTEKSPETTICSTKSTPTGSEVLSIGSGEKISWDESSARGLSGTGSSPRTRPSTRRSSKAVRI
jgi:hypothetical protein